MSTEEKESLSSQGEEKEMNDDEKDVPTEKKEEVSTAENEKEDDTETTLSKEDEYLDGWKRARADYENLQRETQDRIQRSVKFATEGLIQELLPIVDHFKYAFRAIPENEKESSWLVGIEHIQTNFLRVLEENGVTIIQTVGEKFNPEMHEAVEEVPAKNGEKSGTIAEEVSTGFLLHGKVIKCATVKIFE